MDREKDRQNYRGKDRGKGERKDRERDRMICSVLFWLIAVGLNIAPKFRAEVNRKSS
jgi:hypothetical protein